jgi:hypothetical protein
MDGAHIKEATHMKQSVNKWDFRQAFERMGRSNQFSLDGLSALFDYLEEYEESTGTETDLDVIALCCDYTEAVVSDVLKDYNLESLSDLRDHTTVIDVDTSDDDENKHTVIYQAF